MMLSYQQIQAVTAGAMDVRKEADGSISFHRFNEAQRAVYSPDQGFYRSAGDTASVSLDFYTDSDFLRFTGEGTRDRGDDFVIFDLLVDGQFSQTVRLSHTGEPVDSVPVPFGPVTDTFFLPRGEKRVSLYLPWNANTRLRSVELSAGASLRPHRHKYTGIAFGDSITHGCYAQHPSMTYVNQLSRLLDAQMYNFGISGEAFREKKIVAGSYPACDFVTVAYGTNDFKVRPREVFEIKMPSFLRQTAETFPDVPVFILTPLWRNAEKNGRQWDLGTLPQVRARIAEEAAKYPNFHVVDGSRLVPHCDEFFADRLNVHPNDAGFACYALNLFAQIAPHLR